ncbi:MAG: TPM domain-containing protein [Clostridia bacterium]|nr:TPM domain-containing protein [Clostridia bacterium]
MKRIFALSFCLLLLVLSALPCAAASSPVRLDNELTEQEAGYLDALFETVQKAYGVEAFFLINYDYSQGDEFKAYVDEFLDANRTGGDAMIFAVSSDNYRMITQGKAKDLLTTDDIGTLYDAIKASDESGEQYTAAVQFYTALNTLLAERSGVAAARLPDPPKLPGSVPIPDEISPVRGDRLVDQADLLNDADEAALQDKLDRISEEMQFDVVIVTCEHIGSRTPMEFADDYFDYNGFGYGENHDGVALLISMAERDWWISTCGYGQTALSDDYFMKYISASDFYYALGNNHYIKSFNAFADTVEDFVIEARTDKPYSQDHKYHAWSSVRVGLVFSLVVGLAVAAGVTHSKKEHYSGYVRSKGEAGDYMVGSVNLTEQLDEFLYNKVYRTKRVKTESSSSSSGGSSSYHSAGSHSSSSGRSHGGGGGKF